MLSSTDSLAKSKSEADYGRAGKLYQRALNRFANTDLKQIKFKTCGECGYTGLIKRETVNHTWLYCGNCHAQLHKNCPKAPSRKQIKIIALIIKEIGILARRRTCVKYNEKYLEL